MRTSAPMQIVNSIQEDCQKTHIHLSILPIKAPIEKMYSHNTFMQENSINQQLCRG